VYIDFLDQIATSFN